MSDLQQELEEAAEERDFLTFEEEAPKTPIEVDRELGVV